VRYGFMLRGYFLVLVLVAVAGAISAFTKGIVTLTPSSPADAPKSRVSLAFVPRDTVDVQPDAAKSSAPTVSVTSVFMFD